MFKLYGSMFKTLYTYARQGKYFKINLKEKNLVIEDMSFITGGKKDVTVYLIESDDLKEYGIENCFENPWEDVIPKLYDMYKNSFQNPMKHERKCLFKASKNDEMSDMQIVNALDRDYAFALLNGYLLLGTIKGVVKWEDKTKWFWQGQDKDLVIMKKWLFNEE